MKANPFYRDDWLTVYHGDCRAVMAEMEPESVHCVVTSPPYWGLRDYGTATWMGGDEDCDHLSSNYDRGILVDASGRTDGGGASAATANKRRTPMGPTCRKCGATRQDSQLGLEPTPEEYVASMVAVFREVRRVLRADGTVWLNLGDSYASGGGSGPQRLDELGVRLGTGGGHKHSSQPSGRAPSAGLAQKQLIGIPWRVAFALQADGWYLRSDIIWAKPNPMPESVTDRPTKSHEYIFLLSRSPRYYFDADAVREEALYAGEQLGICRGTKRRALAMGRLPSGNEVIGADADIAAGRNIRSVWTMATQPYPGAHFATFPPKIVEPCIKAGTSEKGVCPECGAPWERVMERGGPTKPNQHERSDAAVDVSGSPMDRNGTHNSGLRQAQMGSRWQFETTGWRPTCMCHTIMLPEPVPATVLDPFAGSGTTGMVAQSLSRRAVLIDLSLDYLGQLMARNAEIPLGLTS